MANGKFNGEKLLNSATSIISEDLKEFLSENNFNIKINADGTQAIEETKQTADTVENIIDETDTTFRPDVDDTKIKNRLKRSDWSLSLQDLINLKSELSESEKRQIDRFVSQINSTVNDAIKNIDLSTLSNSILDSFSNGKDKDFVTNFSLAQILGTDDANIDDFYEKYAKLISGSSKTSNMYRHIANTISEQSDMVIRNMITNATADLERINTIYSEEGTKAVVSYFNAIKAALEKNYTDFDSNRFFYFDDDSDRIKDMVAIESYLADERLKDFSYITDAISNLDQVPQSVNDACNDYIRLLSLARQFREEAALTDDSIGYERAVQQAEFALDTAKSLQSELTKIGANFELPGIDDLYDIAGIGKQVDAAQSIEAATLKTAEATKESAKINEEEAAAANEKAKAEKEAAEAKAQEIREAEEYSKLLAEAYSNADKNLEYDRQRLEAEKEINAERKRGQKQIEDYNKAQEKAAAAAQKKAEAEAAAYLKQTNKAINSSINLNSLVDSSGKIPQYTTQIEKLKAEFANAGQVIGMTDDEISDFVNKLDPSDLNNYQQEVSQLTKKLRELNSNDLFSQNGKFGEFKGTFDSMDDAKKAVEQLASKYKSFTEVVFKDPNPNDGMVQFTTNVVTATGESQKLIATYADGALFTKITQATKATTSFEKITSSLAEKWKNVLGYVASFGSFYKILEIVKQGFDVIKELDSAMIELDKVSDITGSRLQQSFENSTKSAKELGATIDDVISATSDWSRLGYSIDQSEELAKIATLYKNVGDGIDIDTANQSLVSTLQGFKMDAEEAIDIIDAFNEVANNFAIDSAGIGEALQRSAASFNVANTSLNESIALVTATNAVVQDPSRVGNMWKTVSARIRGAKAELEEAGEDTEGMVESTSQLRDLIKGMTGFDIMKDEETFKSIKDIVVGIGKEWENLSDIDQSALLEKLAGKTQANALAAALNNWKTIEKAYETAEKSAGSAYREQEKYAEGLEYRINVLKAQLQDLASTTFSSDFFKVLIDGATDALSVTTNLIDNLGTIPSIAAITSGILSFKNVGSPKKSGLFEYADRDKCSYGYISFLIA